eukprot:Nk52_evm2s328 gene=Nk52_evmTU2s328
MKAGYFFVLGKSGMCGWAFILTFLLSLLRDYAAQANDLRNANGCTVGNKALVCQSSAALGDLSQYTLDCTGLSAIRLEGAGVTGVPSGFFSKCTSDVTEFTLTGNPQLTTIPEGAFSGLVPSTFVLTDNKMITTLPYNMLNVTNILVFNISHNGIKSLSSSIMLGNQPDPLEVVLDLSYNELTDLSPSSFFTSTNIRSVQSFIVSHNQIKTVESAIKWPNSLTEYTYRNVKTTLDLSHNKLSDIEFLKSSYLNICTKQDQCEVNFSYNEISTLNAWFYEGYFSLNLDGNPFYSLPNAQKRSNLDHLSLVDTKNLQALPKNFFLEYIAKSKVDLGVDISCCAMGGGIINEDASYLPDPSDNFTCVYNHRRTIFSVTELTALFKADSNFCACDKASCNMSVNPFLCAVDKTQLSYTPCTCNEPRYCYDVYANKPTPYAEIAQDGDSGSSGNFFTTTTFYILLGCVIVCICIGVGGLVYWLILRKKKRAKRLAENSAMGFIDGEFDEFGRKKSGGTDLYSEMFDEPPVDDGEMEGMDLMGGYDEEFPERLGNITERAKYLEIDDDGRLFVETGDEPPEPPTRNDDFTANNLRRLSKADRKARVNMLLDNAAMFEGEQDLYDPLYLEEKFNGKEGRSMPTGFDLPAPVDQSIDKHSDAGSPQPQSTAASVDPAQGSNDAYADFPDDDDDEDFTEPLEENIHEQRYGPQHPERIFAPGAPIHDDTLPANLGADLNTVAPVGTGSPNNESSEDEEHYNAEFPKNDSS